MKNTFSLDVVHPIYNPHENWHQQLLYYFNEFKAGLTNISTVNLYLVNDGSSQGLELSDLDFLKANIDNFHFISYSQNNGKGYALRKAIEQTKSDILIYTDADYPYMQENAWEMVRLLTVAKFDAVLGVRDNHYYKQLSILRKTFSLSLRAMSNIFFPRIFVKDTQSGLKGLNEKAKEVFLQTTINSFLFDLEFVVKLSKRKDLKLAKIYVHVREGIVFSEMKTATIKKELKSFIGIFKTVK